MTSHPDHASRMAELRARLDGRVPAGRYEDVIDEALAYADQLHEQLEAERSGRAAALKALVDSYESERAFFSEMIDAPPGEPVEIHGNMLALYKTLGESIEWLLDQKSAAEAKLQAAERVVEAARSYRKIVSALATRLERDDGAGSEAWLALADAIAAYDRASTHDGKGSP